MLQRSFQAREARERRRNLWRSLAICDRWPWPVRSGGQHRLAAMLEVLSELGDLKICIVSRDPVDDDARAATSAALPTAQVLEIPLVGRPQRRMAYLRPHRWPWWEPHSQIDFPAVQSSMRAAVGQDRFDLVWAHLTLGAPLLDGWGASVRIVDLPELQHVMRRRRATLGSPRRNLGALRWKYAQAVDTRGWRRVERRACDQASLVTVCSETDRQALGGRGQVIVVPNGYKIPPEPVGRSDVAGPATLAFQGTMSYYPNSDAAGFFARDVFPLIRQHIPEAQFRVVGRAGPDVLGLSESEGVVIVGGVDQIEDELAKAHAVVVPLRIGSGTRVKILEAWAYGIPVVSTTVGAEGLPVSHAENLLLADAAPALAEACIRVLTDEDLRRRLAASGRRTVESALDWTEIQARLGATLRAELEAKSVTEEKAARRPSSRP